MGVKRVLYSLALSLLMLAGYTQPTITWQKSLGGIGFDAASSIQQTSDGGYIVAGYSESNDGDVTGNHGDFDYWVVKLTNTGQISWQKSLGGTDIEYARSIQQTSDGGYIVAGYSKSNDGDLIGNHGDRDYWIIKLTNIGGISWQKSLGGSADDIASSIQQTTDGGYIVAGHSKSTDGDVTGNHGGWDVWVVKLTNTGALSWQKSLGGTDWDEAFSVRQTIDGGYIVAGHSESNDGDVTVNHGHKDYWVIKLTNTGMISWQKSLGGSGYDYARLIQQTSDGGYIVAGISNSTNNDVTGNHGSGDYWIVKLTNVGAISWQKSLGGPDFDEAYSIQQTNSNGYIIAGHTRSNYSDVSGNHGDHDFWVVELTDTGTISWQKCLGGISADMAFSIQQTTDGGYIVAGQSQSIDGDVTGNHGFYDCWVVKLSAVIGEDELEKQSLFSIYPNPAKDKIKIKTDINVVGAVYTIYNILGNSILTGKLQNETNSIDLGKLGSGVYVMQLKTSGEVFVSRFSKE